MVQCKKKDPILLCKGGMTRFGDIRFFHCTTIMGKPAHPSFCYPYVAIEYIYDLLINETLFHRELFHRKLYSKSHEDIPQASGLPT